MAKLRAYYVLTKPGIIYGNTIHLLAGLCIALGVGYRLNIAATVGVIIGTGFVIASACVVNNMIDVDIDARMSRTKKRPSVTREIKAKSAWIFAGLLCIFGIVLLTWLTNELVVILAGIAYIFYTILYGIAKRQTVHGTLVGTVPGALPAVAGYAALSGRLDVVSLWIFLMLVAWQMPHFFAISYYRRKEYEKAQLPVLGVVASLSFVKQSIIFWITVYVLTIIGLFLSRGIAWPAFIILEAGALYWLRYALRSAREDMDAWAKRLFGISLLLSLLFLMISLINIVWHP